MNSRKFTFLAVSQFIHHHLLWFLISAYTIAAVFPTAGLASNLQQSKFGLCAQRHVSAEKRSLWLIFVTVFFCRAGG